MKYQRIRGMQDLLPDEQPYWSHVEATCHDLATRFGFERLEPPLLEATELFVRGVGDATDIVSKEMYSFVDKGEDALTLRPEFTAGVMRAYIENGLSSRPQPQKLYSFGPIFRRERPAKGRYRQFYQLNAEIIGSADALADLEILLIAHSLYREIGFENLVFRSTALVTRSASRAFWMPCGPTSSPLPTNSRRLIGSGWPAIPCASSTPRSVKRCRTWPMRRASWTISTTTVAVTLPS